VAAANHHQQAIKDVAGGGYCWGVLAGRQGNLYGSAGKVHGKWAGWVLWSANPLIQAHEAWCEGEGYTFFEKSALPIVAMGEFAVSRRFGLAVRVFGFNGAGTASPAAVLRPGPILKFHDATTDTCVLVTLHHNGVLATTTAHGSCP
jgi:hypothetical protein